jgi:hypothetical protein
MSARPRPIDESPDLAPANDDKTMPLGVGEFAGEDLSALDPLAGAETARRFRSGSIVLVGVVAIACGGLWLMRTVTSVRASSGRTNEIEQTVEKFLSAIKGDEASGLGPSSSTLANADQGVLDVLKQTYTDRQVPLSDVQRDPFIIFDETGGTPVAGDGEGMHSRLVASRKAEFDKAAATLRLKSVIMGSQPLANISSKIVRAGDEFVAEPHNVTFRVLEITSDLVKLKAEDPILNLTVGIDLLLKRDQIK